MTTHNYWGKFDQLTHAYGPDVRPVRAEDGSNPDRYDPAPVMLDAPDNEPADVDWDSPGGFSGDPLETPKHPAYRLPTRWQGTTLEAMGF